MKTRPKNMRRFKEVNWNQLRTGHSSMARADLARSGIIDDPSCLDCGETDTDNHIFTCQKGDRLKQLTRDANKTEQLFRNSGKLFTYLRRMERFNISAEH